MKAKTLALAAVLTVLFSASAAAALAGHRARHAAVDVTTVHDLSLELVGAGDELRAWRDAGDLDPVRLHRLPARSPDLHR